MNNGRDCPHGRQVGKCDTCDLIKAELELEKVTAERDVLACLICKEPDWVKEASRLGKLQSEAFKHLAAHDAEVAKAAFIAGFNTCFNYDGDMGLSELSNNYSQQVKNGW